MGLQLGEIDFNDLIVILFRSLHDLWISRQQGLVDLGQLCQIRPIRNGHIVDHLLIEWKDRCGRTKLRTHVANRTFPGGTDCFSARSKVFNDLIGSTLHRQ